MGEPNDQNIDSLLPRSDNDGLSEIVVRSTLDKGEPAMTDFAERVNTPISTKELERRWTAVRAAMTERKIDVLLMQNNNDFMGGYVKYFTDVPATNGYPVTVVFPADERM